MIDPALRCDSCQEIVKLSTLHQLGCCPKCGNKRVKTITVMNEKEKAKLKQWGFDDLLKEFEEVPDE